MGLFQRDSENADLDISSKIAVLTDTVDVSGNYVVRVMLGDGAKGLDGTGGDFELSISIDGRVAQPNPQVIAVEAATTEGNIESLPFISLAGEEVIAYVLSPNAADTDVDVTASLQDLTRALPAVAPGAENGVPTLSASLAVKANLAEILGTALTETGGYIAAGFKKLFNVATPVLVASDVMRGTDGVDTAAMRGTDGAVTSLSGVATEVKQNTAQSDLDIITGSDGVTLATAQALYAPAKVGAEMGVSAGGVTAIWAKVVDTGFSALATLKRLLSVRDGDIAVSGTDPKVYAFKDKDDALETTHSVDATTGNRTVS